MKPYRMLAMALLALGTTVTSAQQTATSRPGRAMWASVNKVSNASLGDYISANGKLLISWRMLAEDDAETSFLLYRRVADNVNASLSRITSSRITNATCYAASLPSGESVYYLIDGKFFASTPPIVITKDDEKLALREAALDSLHVGEQWYKDALPYVEIPLKSTEDVSSLVDEIRYQANDCSVGDLDGDGQMEIVVKRLLSVYDTNGTLLSDGTGAGSSDRRARHCVVWDAYKLDGTFLWRIKSGPNIILGNSSNFAVADLDGDGKCEFVTKTGEGTVFGDGTEIGDTDDDGVTDYRDNWPGHYTGPSDKGPGGPEFFSVCDGATGRELARAPFIDALDRGATWLEQSESWGDNYWKRGNSLRLGAASFLGDGTMQVFLGRGVYARTVVEGWKYAAGELTRLFHFDSSEAGGRNTNKDGRQNSDYASQGNHSFNVADLDGDGMDEVMYGSCAFDNDGYGLWTSRLGHGDANHVGKFLPDREGQQVFHCLETGTTMVALHDAKTGSLIWSKRADTDNDTGRALVADIDPNSPGCEFWWAGSNAHSATGADLGYKPSSCNMAIWFDGTLSRQLLNENIIQNDRNGGRTFTMYRYDESFNNGTKSNPGWYGDFLGDWREEVIVPDQTKLKNLKVFSTWYPTTHKFPWLMLDHTYKMATINQNVGYNQPNNLSYYLGTDLKSDAEAWEAFRQLNPTVTGIESVATAHEKQPLSADNGWYNMMGQKVERPARGLYIHQGRKVLVR